MKGVSTARMTPEEGGYTVGTSNYVADDDQKKRAVRNTGHHPKAMPPPKDHR